MHYLKLDDKKQPTDKRKIRISFETSILYLIRHTSLPSLLNIHHAIL